MHILLMKGKIFIGMCVYTSCQFSLQKPLLWLTESHPEGEPFYTYVDLPLNSSLECSGERNTIRIPFYEITEMLLALKHANL